MNRTEYIGKLNALYVGDKNGLEELITAYDEKDKEIERLNNIIELALDYLDNGYCYCKDKKIPKPYFDYQELVNILKGSDKE